MAISVNQGHVRSLNLSESPNDSLLLDNLATGTISEDISIFSNNTKNFSAIVWKPSTNNFTITETGNPLTTLFKFDLLSCYGNGDTLKVRSAKIVTNIAYVASASNSGTEILRVTFNSNHNISGADVGKPIKLYDTFFSVGTTFFNNKSFIIDSIHSATAVDVRNIGWEILNTDVDGNVTLPGTFSNTNRYPYATCDVFQLPSYTIPSSQNPNQVKQLSYSETYKVVLTNGINEFKIASSYTRGQLVYPFKLQSTVVNDPLVFERNNQVIQENLLNLAKPDFIDEDLQNENIYFNDVLDRSIGQNFTELESSLDSANYFRIKKYSTVIDNTFTENPLKLEGSLSSFDPDRAVGQSKNTVDIIPNVSDTVFLFYSNTSGVFIASPDSTPSNIIKLRSFSDNTSPWEENSGVLEFSAGAIGINSSNQSELEDQEMSIGNLILEVNNSDNQALLQVSTTQITNAATTAGSFTHKLPVLINGEEYNLLLKGP